MCNIYIYLWIWICIYVSIQGRCVRMHWYFWFLDLLLGQTIYIIRFVGPPKGELRNILIISYHIKISLLISATHDGAKKTPCPNISKPVHTFEKKHVGCTYSCLVGGWIDICQAQMKENNTTTTLYQGDCRDKHYSITHIFSYLVPLQYLYIYI